MTRLKLIVPVLLAALLVGLSGCDSQRDPGLQRATLKGGKKVSQDMVGWVAMPGTVAPEIKQDKDKGVTYALLSTDNVVSGETNGWIAINPKYFSKFAKVTLDEPKAVSSSRWDLDFKGKKIPQELTGWVAIPNTPPKIERDPVNKTMEMATIWNNQVIPSEMHGWVAIDKDTMAKLAEKYMFTGPGADVGKSK